MEESILDKIRKEIQSELMVCSEVTKIHIPILEKLPLRKRRRLELSIRLVNGDFAVRLLSKLQKHMENNNITFDFSDIQKEIDKRSEEIGDLNLSLMSKRERSKIKTMIVALEEFEMKIKDGY